MLPADRPSASAGSGWDAQEEERLTAPQFAWGQRVLARLPLRGDERVLEVGCRTGRLTEVLAERLPHGHVVALDVSTEMLAGARVRLAPLGGRVSLVHADAASYVEVPPVDAVFSTATLPLPEHEAFFTCLAESLRPGGQFVSQMAGGANLSQFRARVEHLREDPAFALYLRDLTPHPACAMPDETRERLERAGFTGVRAWLEAAPVRFEDGASYAEFVSGVVLPGELARMPDEASGAFVARLVELARGDDPPYELDCWRLNLDGTRG